MRSVDRLILSRVRVAFGGKLHLAISGGLAGPRYRRVLSCFGDTHP